MPIGNITQSVSTIPAPPHRGVDVQTVFVNKQEDFQDHLADTTIDELNTFKAQLNTRIDEINSTATTMNGYANTASAGASTATTKAGEASTSASQALTYKNQASASATAAAASAASLTPSGILTAIKTVDGTGSGLDADLLGGLDSSEFVRKSIDSVITKNIYFNNGSMDSNGFTFISNTGATPSQDINVDIYNGTFRLYRNSGLQPLALGVDNNLYSDNGTNGNGKVLTSTTPLGYSTSSLGVGGTTTQGSLKTDALTLNKLTGFIITANSALAAGASNTFTLNNNLINTYDIVTVTPFHGYVDPVNYRIEVVSSFAGGCRFKITNTYGSSLSEALAFKFLVIKGVNS